MFTCLLIFTSWKQMFFWPCLYLAIAGLGISRGEQLFFGHKLLNFEKSFFTMQKIWKSKLLLCSSWDVWVTSVSHCLRRSTKVFKFVCFPIDGCFNNTKTFRVLALLHPSRGDWVKACIHYCFTIKHAEPFSCNCRAPSNILDLSSLFQILSNPPWGSQVYLIVYLIVHQLNILWNDELIQ